MSSKPKPKVIILGGGVAGMSAAHELMERGFTVEVYEKQQWYSGGKARSVDVPGSNKIRQDLYLPGEHGFRFFPGFYKHVTDTMKRIPFGSNKQGVFDNLVYVERSEIARYGKKPVQMLVNFPKSMAEVHFLIQQLHEGAGTDLAPGETELFASKVWQLMCSCEERRMNEYERIGWWQFMDADNHSEAYQSMLVKGLTRTLVAANAKKASTKTGGDIFLQLIFNIANPASHTDRVLNHPTNEAWLTPWLQYLQAGGVDYNRGCVVTKLEMDGNKISGAWIQREDAGDPELVTGDYYILAVPVEAAAPLITDEMVAHDTILGGVRRLADSVAWMNGIQFYLNEHADFVRGHCIYSDTPWALTSISQEQFWNGYDLSERGNGDVKCVLSIDISDWEDVGGNNKAAKDCTMEEIAAEVWDQLKKSINYDAEILRDEMVVDWYLDADIQRNEETRINTNYEPLLVNTVNSWCDRPKAYTNIPNLFLASDYVRTYTDLATMEGANEAARRAVNSIIDCSGENVPLCDIWNLHEPEILAHYKWHDKKRYAMGLPYKYHEPFALKAIEEIRELVSDAKKEVKSIVDWMKAKL